MASAKGDRKKKARNAKESPPTSDEVDRSPTELAPGGPADAPASAAEQAPAEGLVVEPGGAFVMEEGSGILRTIRALEEEIDSNAAITQALETDLEAAKSRIDTLERKKTKLERRVEYLNERDRLADQLQAEVDFLNEDKASSVVAAQELESRLAELSKEKDALESECLSTGASLAAIKKQAVELQAKVVRLEKSTSAMEHLQDELALATSELRQTVDRAKDLETKLEAMSIAKDAMELDLKSTQRVVEDLGGEAAELKAGAASLEEERTRLRSRLKIAEYENMRLSEINRGLESKVSGLVKEKHSLEDQVHTAKDTITDIHGAIEGAKLKARKLYYEPGAD